MLDKFVNKRLVMQYNINNSVTEDNIRIVYLNFHIFYHRYYQNIFQTLKKLILDDSFSLGSLFRCKYMPPFVSEIRSSL